jgi:hypothetical protein
MVIHSELDLIKACQRDFFIIYLLTNRTQADDSFSLFIVHFLTWFMIYDLEMHFHFSCSDITFMSEL